MSNPRHQDPGATDHPQNPPEPQARAYQYNTSHETAQSHEPQSSGPQEWKNEMCGCFGDCGICCTGYWCPCILYGKTKHRIRNPGMEKYSCCNGSCMGFAVLATCLSPCYVILQLKQRAEIRQTYNLEGGGCGDYFRSLCCACCSLIQEEREVIERAKAMNQGYQAPNEMVYGR